MKPHIGKTRPPQPSALVEGSQSPATQSARSFDCLLKWISYFHKKHL